MNFLVNPERRVNLSAVGRDGSVVICVDDFMLDPGSLVALATRADFIDVGSSYPGVRAPVPQAYVDAMLEALGPVIEAAYGAPPFNDLDLCAFSMVTSAPAKLRSIQCIPHFDGPDSGQIAFLHYLCEPHHGGTSFYRHRATGLETVTPDRVEEYRLQVVRELALQAPLGYADESTQCFERIHSVGAIFNRLLIYKGNALHSGDISATTVLTENAREGRLTINGFGHLRAT